MDSLRSIALVTGASSGLGAEFCRQLADRCDVIIGVARRLDRLQSLGMELAQKVEFHPLQADLTQLEGVAAVMEALRQKGPVNYLINNAGFSTFGAFPDLPVTGQRKMVDLHVDASLTLCRAAIPFMRDLGSGAIINVSSLAALVPASGLAVYAASKSFLNTFSQRLQGELEGTGIEVQALCPGYIHTEFHEALKPHGFDEGRVAPEMWMSPKAVVSASLAALGTGQVIVIPGEINRALVREELRKQLDAI